MGGGSGGEVAGGGGDVSGMEVFCCGEGVYCGGYSSTELVLEGCEVVIYAWSFYPEEMSRRGEGHLRAIADTKDVQRQRDGGVGGGWVGLGYDVT